MYEAEAPGPAILVTVATGVAIGLDHVLLLLTILIISAILLIRIHGRRALRGARR